MKKIKILKVIVEIIWWLSFIGIALVVLICLGLLFGIIPTTDDFKFFISGVDATSMSLLGKSILIPLNLAYLLVVYCIYLFRQIIHSFNSLKIFENLIVENFKKIGKYLIIVGITHTAIQLTIAFFYQNPPNDGKLEFGGGIILISLGLFSIILSEIFVITKTIKVENDLTI